MTTQLPESRQSCWCLGLCGKTSTSKWISCGLFTWVNYTDTNETCWATPLGFLNVSKNHTSYCTPLGCIDITTTPQYKQTEITTCCYRGVRVTPTELVTSQIGQAKDDPLPLTTD